MGWIDVHTHLNMLESTPEASLQAARAAGVTHMITIGTTPEDLATVLEISRAHFPAVGCTLGVHPHEASLYNEQVEQFIRESAKGPEVVAIGETGLDYYYNRSAQEVQIHAFRSQMALARELALPVEIHTRDAEPDTIEILRDFCGDRRGLLHCFTGSWELATAGLDNGFDISISGVVTFKNAEPLRDIVRRVPLDRLHVETDAPFLAPVPLRGKKNTPAFVIHTAQVVADIKGIPLEDLSDQLLSNARALFTKMNFH